MKIHFKFFILLAVAVTGISIAVVRQGADENTTYREAQAVIGDLVVGITESGSVDIGTTDQVFELDMSALERNSSASSDSSATGGGMGGDFSGGGMNATGGGMNAAGGGMDLFNQVFGMTGGGSYTSSGEDSQLKVREVNVSVGQQVEAGDVLYVLEEGSVEELKTQLQSNVEKARADLEAVYADQKLSSETAGYTYESSKAYGSYADTEYSSTIEKLKQTVTEKEEALDKAQKTLSDYEEQLAQTNTDYEAAQQVQKDSEWSRDNTDKWDDTYGYVTYFQLAQSAAEAAGTLEQKKEQLEKNVEQARENVELGTRELNSAKRNLAQGQLTAGETLKLRQLAYSSAQEAYDLTLAYLQEEITKQEAIYTEASEKWEEFSSHISGNKVCARQSGVITSVSLTVGDSIHTGDTLVTLYDVEKVTMSVSVAENDMADIGLDSLANISFTAYPDQIFQAKVTEIFDAQSDSGGNVTYDVTATLLGDVSGLFHGMTGEITFITKETKQVMYIPNRAVTREGTHSYVKVKETDGTVRRTEITTGFSDGENVEIIEGLSEGDIVLIESKVGEVSQAGLGYAGV